MWKIKQNENLSVGDIKKEMLQKKPLPIGKTEFTEWSDRIIAGAMVKATPESLKFSLAAMLMTLSPTEAFKEDAYFVLSLRKAAVNETAHAMMTELKEAQKKKLAEETAPPTIEVVSGAVLANKEIQAT